MFLLRLYRGDGDYRRIVVDFRPGEERALDYALPNYAANGIVLVDANYPPLPDPLLHDSVMDYAAGVVREFPVRVCDRYFVQLIAQTGKVSYKFGANGTVGTLDASLPQRCMIEKKVDWEAAPVFYVIGVTGGGSASLHIEALGAGEMGQIIVRAGGLG
jgi:hypothetical protein